MRYMPHPLPYQPSIPQSIKNIGFLPKPNRNPLVRGVRLEDPKLPANALMMHVKNQKQYSLACTLCNSVSAIRVIVKVSGSALVSLRSC